MRRPGHGASVRSVGRRPSLRRFSRNQSHRPRVRRKSARRGRIGRMVFTCSRCGQTLGYWAPQGRKCEECERADREARLARAEALAAPRECAECQTTFQPTSGSRALLFVALSGARASPEASRRRRFVADLQAMKVPQRREMPAVLVGVPAFPSARAYQYMQVLSPREDERLDDMIQLVDQVPTQERLRLTCSELPPCSRDSGLTSLPS